MSGALLSSFTPSFMKVEASEALFVQREELAQRLVQLIRESMLTDAKVHNLLIGPRGIGKTHIVALTPYRVQELYSLFPKEAEHVGAELLKEYVGDRTLLILGEKWDDLFNGLGDKGPKRLLSYLQENPFCSILATAQRLFI